MTFRWKTTLLVVLLTLVTTGLAFAGVWYYFVASQRSQLDEALVAVANREAAEAAMGQLSFSDAPGPSANAVGPLPKYGVIYSRDGVALTTTDNFTTAPPMPRQASLGRCFDYDYESVPLRAVLVGVPQSSMRVLLASPRTDIEDDAQILATAMGVAFAVGCAWSGLLAFWGANRLTRHYRVVESVARRVAAGDASARVSVSSFDANFKELASDLNAMIDRLVGLAATQDRFVAHAAHELRTPLTALRIELEHALATARQSDEYESAIRGALDSGRRLSTLADDLLVVAKARASKGSMARVELADSMQSAATEVGPLALERGITIHVAARQPASVAGDARNVTRIVRNLLENAVRFSPANAVVEVDLACDGPQVELRVRDQGSGVAASDSERIFEPFERVPAEGDRHEGAGLGLSIARSLARSMGGDVALRAGTGGATFVVSLPLAPAPELRHTAIAVELSTP